MRPADRTDGFRAFGRLGHAARDAPGVAVRVEVAHQGAVGKVELLTLAQPPAEFRDSPVVVGRAVRGRLELLDGAALRGWQMTRTADPP